MIQVLGATSTKWQVKFLESQLATKLTICNDHRADFCESEPACISWLAAPLSVGTNSQKLALQPLCSKSRSEADF